MNSRRNRIKVALATAWAVLSITIFAVLALTGIVGGVAAFAAVLLG